MTDRENQGFPEEALRERCGERNGGHHVAERHPLKSVKSRSFVGEFAGRQLGQFPQLRLPLIGTTLRGSRALPVGIRQMLALTEILHELRGQIAGHPSFRSRKL